METQMTRFPGSRWVTSGRQNGNTQWETLGDKVRSFPEAGTLRIHAREEGSRDTIHCLLRLKPNSFLLLGKQSGTKKVSRLQVGDTVRHTVGDKPGRQAGRQSAQGGRHSATHNGET